MIKVAQTYKQAIRYAVITISSGFDESCLKYLIFRLICF